jgi:hypothetical protein
VFLEVMTDTGDIRGDLDAVAQAQRGLRRAEFGFFW